MRTSKKSTQKKNGNIKSVQKKCCNKTLKTITVSENVINNENDMANNEINQEKFYCKNSNLLKEMLKWKNSTNRGLKVYKMVNNKLILTEQQVNGDYQHEKYEENTRYFIKYTKNDERYKLVSLRAGFKPFKEMKNGIIVEEVTHMVQSSGYAFDIDEDESHRTFTEMFGKMLIMMGKKVSNHSYFRNYTNELKEDMQSYGYEKVIRGLPNYNFKYENAFAYLTSAFFNSFKSILSKHYKQVNIKRDLTKRAMVNLQSEVPGSSMEKCLGNQFNGNDYDNFSEY